MNYNIPKGSIADVTTFGPIKMVLVTNRHGELYEGWTGGVERALPVHLREAQSFLNVMLSKAELSRGGRQLLTHIFGELEARFQAIV